MIRGVSLLYEHKLLPLFFGLVVTLNFGTPEVSFNESEGIYRMCIVKDGVALQRITVRLTDTSGTAIRNQGKDQKIILQYFWDVIKDTRNSGR